MHVVRQIFQQPPKEEESETEEYSSEDEKVSESPKQRRKSKPKYTRQMEAIQQWKQIDQRDDFALYQVSGQDFFQCQFDRYESQRALDSQHVFKLTESLSSGSGLIYHPFILIHCPKAKSIVVMDGSHRMAALQGLSEIRRKQLFCYIGIHTKHTTDKQYLLELFYQINNIRGITVEEKKQQISASDMASYLQTAFGMYRSPSYTKIVSNKEQSSLPKDSKWKIGLTTLKMYLEDHSTLLERFTKEELFAKMKEINDQRHRQQDTFLEAFATSRSEKSIEFCKKYKFYIGIDFPEVLLLLE